MNNEILKNQQAFPAFQLSLTRQMISNQAQVILQLDKSSIPSSHLSSKDQLPG